VKAKKLLNIHQLLTDRIRLSIMAALISSDSEVSFSEMLEELGVTRGNLSAHIKKLEKGEFVVVKKEFVNGVPKTTYKYSKNGKKEFKKYLDCISLLIDKT